MSDELDDNAIHELRRRIAAAPLDLELRFQLGDALFRRGDVNSAIPELQRARYHPAHRVAALQMLAEAFTTKGMHDLADLMRRRGSGPDDDHNPPQAT